MEQRHIKGEMKTDIVQLLCSLIHFNYMFPKRFPKYSKGKKIKTIEIKHPVYCKIIWLLISSNNYKLPF